MNGKIMLNGKAYSSSGRPSREITMAQWLALPDTKYTDGIVYYIKDVGGANQFPPLIYSDEEREIGVWRDGKPLYQKTIDCGAIPSNNSKTISPPSNIDKIIGYSGFTYYDASNVFRQRPLPFPADSQNTIRVDLQDGLLRIVTYGTWDNYVGYITLLYTKTTDTPGSGTWTTDGTYAKHYSTEEKVVGTWIDGKPIYERTNTFTNSSGISGEVNLMTIDSTWRLIDAKIHVYNSSNQRTYFFPYMTSVYNSIMVSNGYLKLVSNDSWSSAYSPFYITIQYTKTTD